MPGVPRGSARRDESADSAQVEPITKELPLEYAVELNRLIELEMTGSIG